MNAQPIIYKNEFALDKIDQIASDIFKDLFKETDDIWIKTAKKFKEFNNYKESHVLSFIDDGIGEKIFPEKPNSKYYILCHTLLILDGPKKEKMLTNTFYFIVNEENKCIRLLSDFDVCKYSD